jgi:hypothetical protein
VNLVAYVDSLHTREGVRADLEAIFSRNPHAIALLDDCRHAWGPYVQAGVVDFMEHAAEKHHFRLAGDLAPGLARSNLGVLYPQSLAGTVNEALAGVAGAFSKRLDPLRLLRREEELVSTVNRLNRELNRVAKNKAEVEDLAEERTRQLKRVRKDKAQAEKIARKRTQELDRLLAHYSSRRYRLADAIVGRVLRIPGAKRLLQRHRRA